MSLFNNQMPGDMITLDMRIREDVRHVLKAMFISSDDKKKMLEDALEQAICSGNIMATVEKYAHQAINEAVQEYFKYGEGGIALRKAIADVLQEVIPGMFKKGS